MKNNKAKILAVAVALGLSTQANAAIELYNQDGTTFSVDGSFNAFYSQTDSDASGDQSRIRSGFLPSWIGFNASKQIDDLTFGGRSSFWVTINSGNTVTDTPIDVRQFYATVDGEFGQILFGQDFSLFARSNVFSDEILLGTGLPQPDTSGVTFGNIGVGYPYITPRGQITYRSPVNNGFQIAVGLLDPTSASASGNNNNEEELRVETEVTYATNFDGGAFNAWLGLASGESDTDGGSVEGAAYGARITLGGFKFTASGFDQEGISSTFTDQTVASNQESDGYLLQASYGAGAHRGVISYAEVDNIGTTNDDENTSIAYFYNVNSNFTLVAEYDKEEGGDGQDTDQIAFGLVFNY